MSDALGITISGASRILTSLCESSLPLLEAQQKEEDARSLNYFLTDYGRWQIIILINILANEGEDLETTYFDVDGFATARQAIRAFRNSIHVINLDREKLILTIRPITRAFRRTLQDWFDEDVERPVSFIEEGDEGLSLKFSSLSTLMMFQMRWSLRPFKEGSV